MAYEWDNYRLVCALLNSRKRVNEDILDPFLIENGWFAIDFPCLLVTPGADLEPEIMDAVTRTIQQLRLNDEGTCMKTRQRYVCLYCESQVTFDYLRSEAPFIAMELDRQGLADVDCLRMIMGYG